MSIKQAFKSIFSADKALDIAKNAGDALVYTKEERAEYFVKLLRAYEPFKLSQRLIALFVISAYLIIWVSSAIIYTSSIAFDYCEAGCMYAQLVDASKYLATYNNDTLSMPVSIIIGFYFGGGMIESIAVARKK